MKRRERRFLRKLIVVGTILTLLFGAWWFQPSHIPSNFGGMLHVFDFVLFMLVSYVIWHQICMELLNWSIVHKILRPATPTPEPGKRVAFITTYVPGAETPELLENILPALVAQDYPHDSWLLDEGDDAEAKRLCAKYGVYYFSRKGIAAYNTPDGKFAAKTKGGNHNAWYDYYGRNYDYVAQIDTDFTPTPNFLARTLGYFRDPTVAFVGTPQVYGNLDSWIAKGAAQQQYSFYGPVLQGLFGHRMTLMLGANHVVRVSALKHINYYAGHLTEDLLTGMQLHSKRYRSVYVAEQLAVGLGPTTWESYFNQQARWAHGCIDILLRHSFKLFRSMNFSTKLHYFFLQQHYFAGLASIIGVGLLTLYFMSGITPGNIPLLPMLALYLPLLAWQYGIHRWLQRFYVNPRTEGGIHWNGILIGIAVWPIYFLAFIGALRGKRLTFKVTPKGDGQATRADMRLFRPHIALGTVSTADLVAAPLTGHVGGIMLFWAALTASTMYGIAFHQQFYAAYSSLRKLLGSAVGLRFAPERVPAD